MVLPVVLLLAGVLFCGSAIAGPAADGADSRTVIGSTNPPLTDGAEALLDGDAVRGIELTLRGLAAAQGRRERQAALSNLCAGYILLEKEAEGIAYCDMAIEENDRNWRAYSNRALAYLRLGQFDDAGKDIERGQELAPNARSLKVVKSMLLDETQPVDAIITIDDRLIDDGRQTDDDES